VKDLSVFIWYMIGAMLFFGIWAVVAVVAYIVIKICVGICKPEWLDRF